MRGLFLQVFIKRIKKTSTFIPILLKFIETKDGSDIFNEREKV